MTRLIGYGAYNLCFDRDLGVHNGRDFFTHLHDVKKSPVNLVKVIVFRKASLEGLPELPDPTGRTIPVYTPAGEINKKFLANLVALTKKARDKHFTVQICIFSYHSVARKEGPEFLPAALVPDSSLTRCQRVRKFFSLADPAIVAEQDKLVTALVTTLRNADALSNVLWEIANEIRIDVCATEKQNRAGNCDLVAWLNHIASTIRASAKLARNMITTSTGIHTQDAPNTPPGAANEKMTFAQERPVDGCTNPAFVPHAVLTPGNLFDLHAGQWNLNDNYLAELRGGLRKRFAGYGYDNPSFIINTDGFPDELRTPANIKKWATAAFRNGHHFASKEIYPPHVPAYNDAVLDALAAANAAAP